MGNAEVAAPGVRTAAPEILCVPGWEQYPWLRAGFSTRFAGQSHVYGDGEFNLGWTGEDDPAIVAQNRAVFMESVAGHSAMPMVTVGQVHGAVVWDLETTSGPLMTDDGRAMLEGDGLLSRTAGRLLAVVTADCVPVLVADTRTHAVGAFHAGWRGTLERIAERGIGLMQERYGTRTEDLVAAIGPCIQACCFEVGEDVRERFEAEFAYASTLFGAGDHGGLRLDLVEANRRQLTDAGVAPYEVHRAGACTACARRRDGRRAFYSYRAESGRCGRMLSAIGAVA